MFSSARSGVLGSLLAVSALAIAGCSVHPLPDDVSSMIPTEDIVKSARCEMRLGLFDQVKDALDSAGVPYDPRELQTKEGRKRIATVVQTQPKYKALWEAFQLYGKVAVAYDFDFGITEHNNLGSGLAFKLPLTNSVFDLGAGASVDNRRVGQRTFKAQESFDQMLERDQWCGEFKVRDANLMYPITGSIGLRKVVKTFIAISEAGGGKDSFVDTLTFTTTVAGKLGGTVKINPVPNSFRLVSADAAVAADRTDVHKIVISLAFPVKEQDPDKVRDKKLKQCKQSGICAEDEFPLNPVWRARYNICVADARSREDAFKVLRDSPPEVYCLAYADAFVSRHVNPQVQRLAAPSWLMPVPFDPKRLGR